VKGAKGSGYFARGSMLRRIHQERVVGLLYGQRALAVGAAHPLNYTATAIHSTGRLTPFSRLARTGRMIEAIVLGSRKQGDQALASVNAIHRTVNGDLPCDAGQYPVGTPYSAFDPELMLWTVAVIADSALYFFDLFVRPLTATEKEAAWQDYRLFGELFKLPPTAVPATYAEFGAWWQERMVSDDLYLTPEARQTGQAVAFAIPMPRYAAVPQREHNAIMLGSLPPQVRDLYGLAYTAQDEARFVTAAEKLRALREHSPRWLAHGRNGWFFRWVARNERLRLKRGLPTLQLDMPVSNESDEPSAGQVTAVS
jgi:uncharacterized protein (DUF2236 family)